MNNAYPPTNRASLHSSSPSNVCKNWDKQLINCPVCNASDYKIRYRATNPITDPILLYGISPVLKDTQDLVECSQCKLIYENPRLPDEAVVYGYQSGDSQAHDTQFSYRVKAFRSTLETLRTYIPSPGSKVLDIGAAGGAFLLAAKDFGYEGLGVEPSEYLSANARSRSVNVLTGVLHDHTLPEASFDMITLWDVLEHMTRPREELETIHRLLKPNGILLINFPDIETLPAQLLGRRFWWILSVHLQHFTPPSIRQLCALTGFEAFHFSRYWPTLCFGYLLDAAVAHHVPGSRLLKLLTPSFLKPVAISYYASQTTALARKVDLPSDSANGLSS